MSDDDRKRPPTQGWTFSPTGGMTRNSGEVVVIEEAPSVPSAVDRREEPTAPKHVPPPMPPGRKSTIEEFNEELAALERPLEGEVEYFDEAQPPSRWRQAGAFFAVVVVVGVGGALLISRNRASADARELAAAQAPPAAAAVAAAPPSPALAAAADAARARRARGAGRRGRCAGRGRGGCRFSRRRFRRARALDPVGLDEGPHQGRACEARALRQQQDHRHRTTKTKRTVIAKNTVSRRH